MKQFTSRSQYLTTWLLVIPTLAWFYIGLFLTMALWYPSGLSSSVWQEHILHFSIIYLLWLGVFFSYRLFDINMFNLGNSFFGRLFVALLINIFLAALYFYFQPDLLITPRRFLLVHVLITGIGILIWFSIIRRATNKASKQKIFIYTGSQGVREQAASENNNVLVKLNDLKELIDDHHYSRLEFGGEVGGLSSNHESIQAGSIVVIPAQSEIVGNLGKELFTLRIKGVNFVNYYDLYENLTRSVHLEVLTEIWFLSYVDYGKHQIFDAAKRLIDLAFGLLGFLVFILTFPVIWGLIKLTSPGPVLFIQKRVGLMGGVFKLCKYRRQLR